MDECPAEIEFFNAHVDNTLIERLNSVVESDFGHITYTEAVAELIKNMVRIPRPITSGLIVAEKGFSFPSQHAAVTMIVGVVMYSMDKRIGTVLIVLSLLVGLSRVVLGVHYVVDIFAGWTVGILLGLVFIKIFSKI